MGSNLHAGHRSRESTPVTKHPHSGHTPASRHEKVFESAASFGSQVQSKLAELRTGFETSMHAIHAFRNQISPSEDSEEEPQTTSSLHTDSSAHNSKDWYGWGDGWGELKTTMSEVASNLRGVKAGSSEASSDEEQEDEDIHTESDGMIQTCLKQPVKLKAKGWHVEANACTGAGDYSYFFLQR